MSSHTQGIRPRQFRPLGVSEARESTEGRSWCQRVALRPGDNDAGPPVLPCRRLACRVRDNPGGQFLALRHWDAFGTQPIPNLPSYPTRSTSRSPIMRRATERPLRSRNQTPRVPKDARANMRGPRTWSLSPGGGLEGSPFGKAFQEPSCRCPIEAARGFSGERPRKARLPSPKRISGEGQAAP